MRRYFIKTYGCQMNIADSEKLADVLAARGYLKTPNLQLADLILVNTCVVRQNAEDRAAWYVTSMKNLKKQNPKCKIVLCGCMVTEPGKRPEERFPHVDFFIPPNSPERLKSIIESLSPKSEYRNPKQAGKSETDRILNFEFASNLEFRASNFVPIMTGCDNFCSYCVVPYVRGREKSRPVEEVLAKIKYHVDNGAKSITLLGQNVNSYQYGLANLLKEIQQFVFRHSSLAIRFLTSHPRDMSDEIIETVARLPFVAKEFLLPLQSGDDDMLKKMNRGYDLAHYIGRVKKIRSLLPKAFLSTDIMVGFPGETEEQFQNTLRAVEKIKFSEIHMFGYSARPGTAAAKLLDQLPDEVVQSRLKVLIGKFKSTPPKTAC